TAQPANFHPGNRAGGGASRPDSRAVPRHARRRDQQQRPGAVDDQRHSAQRRSLCQHFLIREPAAATNDGIAHRDAQDRRYDREWAGVRSDRHQDRSILQGHDAVLRPGIAYQPDADWRCVAAAKLLRRFKGLPAGQVVGGRLTVSFQQPVAVSDIDYIVEVSNDMQNWRSTAADVEQYFPATGTNDLQTVYWRSTSPVSGSPKQFIRVRLAPQ